MANKTNRKQAEATHPMQGNQRAEPLIADQDLRGRMAVKAYELSERRGREPGKEVEDWLDAERLFVAELNSQDPKKPRSFRGRRMRSDSA